MIRRTLGPVGGCVEARKSGQRRIDPSRRTTGNGVPERE